jgi:probable rRNA maturation factor
LAIFINNEQYKLLLKSDYWSAQAEAIAKAAGVDPTTEWSLTFVDDQAMRAFNRQFRGIDKPTDVLSFSQLEGEDFPSFEDHVVLGDVVIAVPMAKRQAEERGHALEAEIALLITHGLLHLLGEDHDEPARKAQMWEIQDRILVGLGHSVKNYGDLA